MGWRQAPRERQKHQVVVELAGPIDRRSFASYRRNLEEVARRYGARVTARGILARPRPKAKRGARKTK
jgi:hypothetical protein